MEQDDGKTAVAQAPAVEKDPTGIEGFDQVTGGGLPRGRISMVAGGPGSGKTVFALQSLANAARRGEPGLFVAFEENVRQVVANATPFGWGLPELEGRSLFFFDAQVSPDTVVVGEFDLIALLAILRAKAQRTGARRIVFDALDVLLALLNDPVAERRELYRLQEWLRESGLTGVVTVKADPDDPASAQRFSFLQFMADCVVHLDHRLEEHVSLRGLRVVKYRGSSFAANEFPMTIGPAGIDVAGPDAGDAEAGLGASRERVSTGVERLDTMLSGGYYRGTSTLISGRPGTAKSTLSGAFVEACCRRGERALYVTFDETAGEVVRNLESVAIRLAPHVASGALRIHSARTESRSAEEHLMTLRALVRDQRPECLVIDPLSAMVRAGGSITAMSVAQRLLQVTKAAGITLVCTSLLEGSEGDVEAAEIPVSTMADTWIHLSYVVRGGERNRALSIVKSRGTKHSNQVRELILDDAGVRLADVSTAGGEVLMGTARWEEERRQGEARRRRRAEVERKRRELALVEAEVKAKMQSLERELAARQQELARLLDEQDAVDRDESERRRELLDRRSADANGDAGP